eukprot:scaffold1709_cov74-Skeletonema_dohrnii-CCMP3373.AAC.3
MMLLDDLPTPAFIVDNHVFQQNCKAARAAAAKNGIPRLRPHVKTHKTIEGCIIQAGIDSAGEESLADVIGFVASTLPELSMVAKLECEYKRKPFTYCCCFRHSHLQIQATLNSINVTRVDIGNTRRGLHSYYRRQPTTSDILGRVCTAEYIG